MSIRQRAYPNGEQAVGMLMHCAHARYVWNLALEQALMWRRDKTLRGVQAPNNTARMRQLTEARADSEWLREGATVVQQGALRDFDRAMQAWWARSHRKPRWRKAGRNDGFVIRDLSLKRLNRRWGAILVPKVGWVKFRITHHWRKFEAGTSGRVTLRHGQWHVSFTTPPAEKLSASTGVAIGLDRGVANSIATSEGSMLKAPSLTISEQSRFLALERQLSRQKHGSKRRTATKTAMGSLRLRLTNRRTDWVEQTTTDFARTYNFIAIEALNTRGMTRKPLAKPDPAREGAFMPNGARAKAGLNRAILASCWGRLERRLSDKLPEGHLLAVNPRNTSRRCAECGHTDAESRESQAVFSCRQCGHTAHADTNAARNILARAISTEPEGIGGSGASVPRAGSANHLGCVSNQGTSVHLGGADAKTAERVSA